MPILIKKIDGSIVALLNDGSTDYLGPIKLKKSVVGEIGMEGYFNVNNFEGLTQIFSNIKIEEEYNVNRVGPNNCPIFVELNV